jgi:hypothetical protein
MIALLNTEQAAIDLSNSIHDYLCDNREGYKDQTTKWADLNKSDSEDKWMVKIPPDYPYEGETVESLPENWRIINE